MSSSVDVNCIVVSISLLLEGITELGTALTTEDVRQQSEEKRTMENCEGRKVKVDFVLKNKAGDKIGLRTNEKTQQVEFVTKEPEKASVKESIQAATQAYARLKILNEVKNRGYGKVKEEKLPNGAIRLVVERWR